MRIICGRFSCGLYGDKILAKNARGRRLKNSRVEISNSGHCWTSDMVNGNDDY